MLNVYASATGEYVPADKLQPSEAVDNFERGVLLAVDFHKLTTEAKTSIHQLVAKKNLRRVVLFTGVTLVGGAL